MFVLGLGLGMVMQVLVLAVQNAVDYSDLGVATSGATLFRSIGGSLGTATLGAIFANRLSERAAQPVCPRASPHMPATARVSTRKQIAHLPTALRVDYLHAFTNSLSTVFLVAACDHRRRLRGVVVHPPAATARDGRHRRPRRHLRGAA